MSWWHVTYQGWFGARYQKKFKLFNNYSHFFDPSRPIPKKPLHCHWLIHGSKRINLFSYFHGWSWIFARNDGVLSVVLPVPSSLPPRGPNFRGGVLTLTWYTYMCLPFGVVFHRFWYSDGVVFVADERAQFVKIGCISGNLFKKHPIRVQLGVFCQNWYTDGWVFESKTGIEMGHIFKVRQAHTRTKFF